MWCRYTTAVERGEGPGIILNLARHHNFSPAMMAKFILEQFLSQNPQDDPTIDTTAERLPSPSFIPDSSLAGTDTEREQHKQQIRPQDGHLVDSLLDKTDSRSGDRGATYSSGKTKMSPVTEMCEKEVVATSYLVTGPRENSLGDTSDTANKEPTTPTPGNDTNHLADCDPNYTSPSLPKCRGGRDSSSPLPNIVHCRLFIYANL